MGSPRAEQRAKGAVLARAQPPAFTGIWPLAEAAWLRAYPHHVNPVPPHNKTVKCTLKFRKLKPDKIRKCLKITQQ